MGPMVLKAPSGPNAKCFLLHAKTNNAAPFPARNVKKYWLLKTAYSVRQKGLKAERFAKIAMPKAPKPPKPPGPTANSEIE
jgi:hypothetical protein